jgi:hypothetical protein
MRQFAPVLLASLIVACAQPAAADNGHSGRATAPTINSMPGSSDADLLAERHLALYRAAQQPRVSERSSGVDGDERDGPSLSIRTSATAALPLGPRIPANPSVEH